MASSSTKIPRREFLQLADTFNPDKHKIGGFYVSEKLDGTRCFWDGGITRGQPTASVPWASVADPKTGERKTKIKPLSTGLWSRYGNPIMAPDWWLNCLPACPLDGELWAGRGKFQLCRSICGGDDPDSRFDQISYAVYSSPSLSSIFCTGQIKNANMLALIDQRDATAFVHDRAEKFGGDFKSVLDGSSFDRELTFINANIEAQNDYVFMHGQVRLPFDEEVARRELDAYLEKVLDQGGEGVVIRDPNAVWTPKRHKGLLKYKPFEDAEAGIIGFVAGREGKQGNVLGKIGALVVVDINTAVEFELGSGLTMAQREFHHADAIAWCNAHPGERLPEAFDSSKHFKIGDTVTYKYRELSDDMVPKEGRFWRKRDVE
jgi:DNA ligase-1